MRRNTLTGLVSLLVVAMLPACSGIGPGTIQRDRFDYNGTVARSWKEQTLLNMVKVRYLEFPVFLDIPPSSILLMMQAGWPAHVILRLPVPSVNGVDQGAGARRALTS